MKRVLAGPDGSGGGKGLQFKAQKSAVPPASTTLRTQMDQQGSSVELRDQQNEILISFDGNDLDDLYRNSRLDVGSKERFKQSVYDLWEQQRSEPDEPKTFVLDLTDVEKPEQLLGRLKMLMGWLELHIKHDVAVERQQVLPEVQQTPGEPRQLQPGSGPVSSPPKPKPQVSKQPEESEPADEAKPKAGPSV